MKISSKVADNIVLVTIILCSCFLVNFLFAQLGMNQKNVYYLVHTDNIPSVLGESTTNQSEEKVEITKDEYKEFIRLLTSVESIQGETTNIRENIDKIEDTSIGNYNVIQNQIKELEKSDIQIQTEMSIFNKRLDNILGFMRDFIYPLCVAIIAIWVERKFRKDK